MFQYFDQHRNTMQPYLARKTRYTGYALFSILLLMLLTLAACGDPTGTPSEPRVNGFGTKQNHTHSLAVLPDNVLLLASHYGLFRSSDMGKNWTMVAAGKGQEMEGMMTDSLTYSPLNPKRLYVLTQPTGVTPYKGELGLYTSEDEGQSWKLANSTKAMGEMYFARTGNSSPDEVFIYQTKGGTTGLKVSQDAGQHFTTVGTLPFGRLYTMLALPDKPGELLIGGDNGIARSTDGGQHWDVISGVKNAIYDIVSAGPHGPIYAAGDNGVFASQDGGKTFSSVYAEKRLSFLTVSPIQPEVVYGKTGTAIFRSADGGHTWKQLPAVQGGTIWNLVADPNDSAGLYLTLSYPSAIYHYDEQSGQWTSLTPKA